MLVWHNRTLPLTWYIQVGAGRTRALRAARRRCQPLVELRPEVALVVLHRRERLRPGRGGRPRRLATGGRRSHSKRPCVVYE
jgi:hypothetical protein